MSVVVFIYAIIPQWPGTSPHISRCILWKGLFTVFVLKLYCSWYTALNTFSGNQNKNR